MSQVRWIITPVDGRRDTIASHAKINPIIAQMLLNRGIYNINKAADFMSPQLATGLLDPLLIPGMEKAAGRLAHAIKEGQKIYIWGDYDVDGVTSTATLYHALKHFDADVHTYLPDRVEEGYGLNNTGIKEIADKGCDLLVTVDCGITGVEQAKLANDLDMDIIITDHHEWKAELPAAYALVHPRLPGSKYPNPHLCGAGVAFKLAWALSEALTGEKRAQPDYAALLMELLAFTALGTIADVVPLIDENRIIAHFGMKQLPKSRFIGIKALIKSARFDGQDIDGYKVGFSLAPRLNAAGRMGHANEALAMLIGDDYEAAEAIGLELERKNVARQETERAIVAEALKEAELFPYRSVQVVAGKGWHPGVVGIVASRLVERFHVPAIVLVDSGEELHGSARSIEGFNLAEALGKCDKLMRDSGGDGIMRYGGHAMAAGLKLTAVNYDPFIMAMNMIGDDLITQEMRLPKLEIDAVVSLGEITMSLAQDMARLGPFGSHNRRPLLAVQDCVIVESKTMGKEGKHLCLQVAQGEHRMKALAFGQGDMAHKIPMNTRVDLCVEPTINEFRGQTNVELFVRDILPR